MSDNVTVDVPELPVFSSPEEASPSASSVPVPSPPKMRVEPVTVPTSAPASNGANSDRVFTQAKQIVIDNYNFHRDETRSPALTLDGVYITQFAKTMNNWQATLTSPVARGLMWSVVCNTYKQEAYIEVYKKVNNTKVSLLAGDAE